MISGFFIICVWFKGYLEILFDLFCNKLNECVFLGNRSSLDIYGRFYNFDIFFWIVRVISLVNIIKKM